MNEKVEKRDEMREKEKTKERQEERKGNKARIDLRQEKIGDDRRYEIIIGNKRRREETRGQENRTGEAKEYNRVEEQMI